MSEPVETTSFSCGAASAMAGVELRTVAEATNPTATVAVTVRMRNMRCLSLVSERGVREDECRWRNEHYVQGGYCGWFGRNAGSWMRIQISPGRSEEPTEVASHRAARTTGTPAAHTTRRSQRCQPHTNPATTSRSSWSASTNWASVGTSKRGD